MGNPTSALQAGDLQAPDLKVKPNIKSPTSNMQYQEEKNLYRGEST